MGEDTPLNTAAYYTDPFYAECLTYGRIRDALKKGDLREDITTTCHGFLFLQSENQEALRALDIDLGINDVDPCYQESVIGGFR